MSDTKGVLPTGQNPAPGGTEKKNRGAADSGHEASRLPTSASWAEAATLPPAPVRADHQAAPGPLQQEPPSPPAAAAIPTADTFGPLTRQQRLAAATLAGGFEELPPGFGDSGGDWETVQSDDPFEALFLDQRLAQKVTPELVERHRKLLQAFWQEKIKTMSQGAARLAIARKYGGPQADENRIRSFPDRIEKAFHRLSTMGRIEDTHREIVSKRQRAALDTIEAKMDDFLVDHTLHPQETAALFALADRLEIDRGVVAAVIEKRLQQMGLVGGSPVAGLTAEDRLRSTTWIHLSHLPTPPPAPPAPSKNWLLPIVLLVFLLPAGALAIWRLAPTAAAPPAAAPPAAAPPAAALENPGSSQATKSPMVTSEPPSRKETKAPRERQAPVKPPASAAPPEDAARKRSEELAASREAQLQADLTALRMESERQAAESRLAGWENRLASIEMLIGQKNYDAAHTLVVKLLEDPGLPEELGLRTRQLAADAMAGLEESRVAGWEARLKEIAALAQKGIYTESREKAEGLLKEEGIPPDVADRARQLSAQALAALQAGWSKAKVKSKTVKARDGKHGG